MNKVIFGDNLEILKSIESESINLIYIDPPYNTGKIQKLSGLSYNDKFYNYNDFIKERLLEAYRVLSPNGSLYFHIDYREVYNCKFILDEVFGNSKCFLNEIIWAYDYGGRSRNKWSAKHDNILFYVKDPKNYIFNYENMERIPYMAPNLVGKEKAERGKTVTDVWWHTIVHTTGKERTGYPTQKPKGIIKRIIEVSSNENDLVLDFFAGSGTTGEVCYELNRNFILIDSNPQAIEIMKNRFKYIEDPINFNI